MQRVKFNTGVEPAKKKSAKNEFNSGKISPMETFLNTGVELIGLDNPARFPRESSAKSA